MHLARRACRLREPAAAGVYRAMGRSRRAAAHFAVPASREFVRALQSLAAAATTSNCTTLPAGEIVDAWLYCHVKFILQCNIRAPRYLRNQMRGPDERRLEYEIRTRRVRRDPPTLEEAIFAAIGITDDQEQQAEIAASLMGLPYEEVLAEVKKTGRAAGAIGHPRDRGRTRRAALGRGRTPRRPAIRQRQAHRHLSVFESQVFG